MRLTTIAFVFFMIAGVCSAQDEMFTARKHYGEVLAAVESGHGPNVKLIMAQALYVIGTMPITLDPTTGKAEAWIYAFYSPDDMQLVSGLAVDHPQKGRFKGESGSQPWDPGIDTTELPTTWVDSDAAATAWGVHGTSDFIATHPATTTIGFTLINTPTDGAIWGIVLTDGIDTLACSIDAITTNMIQCGLINALDNLSTPSDFHLSAVYPNPVNRGNFAQIDLTSAKETRLNISIYDIQGRLQGMAFDHIIQPGTTRVAIPSELIRRSGIYIVRAQSRKGFVTRKLIVVW